MFLFDKWNEYKEEQERKKYFRSRNDLYLDSKALTKTIIGGLLVSLLAGIVVYFISNLLSITSSFFYVLLGYAVAYTVKQISGVESRQVAILSVILTIVGSLFSIFVEYAVFFNSMGLPILSMIPYLIMNTFEYIFQDLFLLICIIIGCLVAYQEAK